MRPKRYRLLLATALAGLACWSAPAAAQEPTTEELLADPFSNFRALADRDLTVPEQSRAIEVAAGNYGLAMGTAVRMCDFTRARMLLEKTRELAIHAERVARASEAAGDLSAISPGDARRVADALRAGLTEGTATYQAGLANAQDCVPPYQALVDHPVDPSRVTGHDDAVLMYIGYSSALAGAVANCDREAAERLRSLIEAVLVRAKELVREMPESDSDLADRRSRLIDAMRLDADEQMQKLCPPTVEAGNTAAPPVPDVIESAEPTGELPGSEADDRVEGGRGSDRLGGTPAGEPANRPPPPSPLPPPPPGADQQSSVPGSPGRRRANGGLIVRDHDHLWIWGSYEQLANPQTGVGFRRDGPVGEASEEFAVTSPERIHTIGAGVRAQFHNFIVHVQYGIGDASATAEIPPDAGIDSGIVYGGFSPGDSTGIAGPFGLNARIDVEVESFEIGGGYRVARTNSPENVVQIELWAETFFQRRERDYRSAASSSFTIGTFDGFFAQERTQEIDEDLFELGGRLAATYGDGPLKPYGSIYAGGYHRRSKLFSLEINSNNFTGPPDDDFAIGTRGKDDGFGFHGEIRAGIAVELSPGASLYAEGSYSYRSQAAGPRNLFSGDQVLAGAQTGIATRDVDGFVIGVGFQMSY